jgi:hypothetical protein
LLHTPTPAVITQSALTSNPPKTFIIKPAFFKVQDLLKDPTFTFNLPKTFTIKPVLLISPAVAIPASALTYIPTSAPTLTTPMVSVAILTFTPTFTTPIVSALAPAELTPPPTSKIATALSLATCILTEPQVQPQTLLTLCCNC